MMKYKSKAVQFGNENGYPYVKHFRDFKAFEIYVAETIKEIEFTGYPVLIIATENSVRFTDTDETLMILGIHPVNDKDDESIIPAEMVNLLEYATGSEKLTAAILIRCQIENKRLYAHYPGLDPFTTDDIDLNKDFEPIGEIMDGFLYLVPADLVAPE
jgi:hypothetical protein